MDLEATLTVIRRKKSIFFFFFFAQQWSYQMILGQHIHSLIHLEINVQDMAALPHAQRLSNPDGENCELNAHLSATSLQITSAAVNSKAGMPSSIPALFLERAS